MGQETQCKAVVNGQASEGRLLLETGELIFRGESRLVIPFKDVQKVEAQNGILSLTHSGGVAGFSLGPSAAKWASRIQNPKPLLDKLGVKSGQRVVVLDIDDPEFLRALRGRLPQGIEKDSVEDADAILFGLTARSGLPRLKRFRSAIRPAGMIWAVYPKGMKTITESDVRAAAIRQGLVDVKVVSFSKTHSALKLVIPRSQRP